VREGDRVATTLSPGHAFVELLHACPRLGAVFVPLDPRAPAVEASVTEPVMGVEADVELRTSLDPSAVHSVIHTSGTTGTPKAVELTFANHAASAAASGSITGIEADDRWLCPLPPFHVGGLGVLLRCARSGATAVLLERFDVEQVRRLFEAGEITLASLVPTMLGRLRDAGLGSAPRLRTILLGGGPISGGLLEWASSAGIPVTPVYGMTETASQVVAGIPGRPLPGVELQIGDDGEILVRGPMVTVDGWLHTGDAGRIDADGLLHVEGRIKELIVTGGENVAPAEVEDVLLAHPAVADAGVTGREDEEWGEAVWAFVVLRQDASASELIEWCRARLAPYKVPKGIELVGSLPRNAAGKLQRARLPAGP
jgi:o-succinylbenzoate---CoA ligase